MTTSCETAVPGPPRPQQARPLVWASSLHGGRRHTYIRDWVPLHIQELTIGDGLWVCRRQAVGVHGTPASVVTEKFGPFPDMESAQATYILLARTIKAESKTR